LFLALVDAVICAVAPTSTTLLAGRAVQGLGGAVVTPAALSLLTVKFPTGRTHSIAVSAWTAAAAGGGALGFVVGGLLVDRVGWRGAFWLLTPVAGVVLVALWWVVPATPPQHRTRGLDLAGSVPATGGLVMLAEQRESVSLGLLV